MTGIKFSCHFLHFETSAMHPPFSLSTSFQKRNRQDLTMADFCKLYQERCLPFFCHTFKVQMVKKSENQQTSPLNTN